MRRNFDRVWSRRHVLKGAVAAGAVVGLPAIVSRASERLVVNAHGGPIHKYYEEYVLQPFAQKFGVEIVYDPGVSAPQTYAKIRAAQGSPGFDVASALTPTEVLLGSQEGFLAPVSEAEVPNLKYAFDSARNVMPPNGVIHNYYYLTIVYNPEHIEEPNSWLDYWDPGSRYGDKVKGHVLSFNPGTVLSIYALIAAARTGGGGIDNMDPAWELLARQKPYHGLVVTGSAEAAAMIENGEIWLAPYWSYRAMVDAERGLPVRPVSLEKLVSTNGAFGLAECTAIPIGAANKKLAYEFLNFRLDPEVQKQFSMAQHMGPGRKDVDLPPEFANQQLATEAKMAEVFWPDNQIVAARRRDWTLKWQEVMG